MWTYTNQDELYHFGVLGMRWHMRKAAIKGQTYDYKSRQQKKYQKKFNLTSYKNEGKILNAKQEQKFNKLKDKLEAYKLRDKSRVDYAKSQNIGMTILNNIFFGQVASGSYNRYRNAGYSKLKAALHATLNPFMYTHYKTSTK